MKVELCEYFSELVGVSNRIKSAEDPSKDDLNYLAKIASKMSKEKPLLAVYAARMVAYNSNPESEECSFAVHILIETAKNLARIDPVHARNALLLAEEFSHDHEQKRAVQKIKSWPVIDSSIGRRFL